MSAPVSENYWLDRSASVVAAGAGAFVAATLLFAAGFFSVIGYQFARFYNIDELSPLFLPSFIWLIVIVAVVVVVILLARLLGGERASAAGKPRANPDRQLRQIRLLGWIAFAGYLVLAIFFPLSWYGHRSWLLFMIWCAIDDQYYWVAVRDDVEVTKSNLPLLLFAAAYCFTMGQGHAFWQMRGLDTYCARFPIDGDYFEGVVLLKARTGYLGFDAKNHAFVQVDAEGHVLEQRPFDPSRSLVSTARPPSVHDKLLVGYSCIAHSRSSDVPMTGRRENPQNTERK